MIGLQLPAFPKDNILNRKELWAQPRIGWPGRGGRGYSCLDILEGMPSEAETCHFPQNCVAFIYYVVLVCKLIL